MPSQTFLVRSHARTIHTHPVTFVCAECHTTTTREIYPGKIPTYCLSCRPRRKRAAHERPTKGMFHPTHYLIAANGRKTEVCLEKSSNPGWSWVRTALDWFSGSSIIQYHPEKGIISHETPLSGYTLTPLPEELQPQVAPSKAKSKVKKQAGTPTAPVEDRPYSGRALMKRLKCGDRLLRIKRSQPDFTEWSQERDPDGIAWKYTKGQFVPLKVSKVDTASVKEEAQPKPSSTKSKTKQKQKTTNKTKKTSVAKAPSLESKPLSGRQMMKRLKCGDRLLRIKRSQPDFSEWSQERDPDNVAWEYKDGEFFPIEITKPEPSKKESQPKPSKSKTKTKTKSKAKQSQKTTQKSKKEPVQAVKTEVPPLSGRQMMKRLKCGDRLLRIKRSQPDFTEWSQERDPDNVAWQYKEGQFVPLEVSTLDSEPSKVKSPPKPSKSKTKTKSKTKQNKKTVKKKTTKKTKAKVDATTTSLENRAYTVRQVMERFHCGDRLLRIKRDQPDFTEWSQKRDPDGIPWNYTKGQFVPQMG